MRENLDYLDGKHTIFGTVTEGLDVLDKINNAYTDKVNNLSVIMHCINHTPARASIVKY